MKEVRLQETPKGAMARSVTTSVAEQRKQKLADSSRRVLEISETKPQRRAN
jgi:hypothetical protein